MTVKNKNAKMHRETACAYLDWTVNRIRAYNKDERNPYTIKKMVVFGSYMDRDKEMLSDLDVALGWELKSNWQEWEQNHMDEIKKFYRIKGIPMVDQSIMYMRRRALIQIRKGNCWVHFTSLDREEEREIVYSGKHMEIDL